MQTYLERYLGEYVLVWKELVALGEQIWTEPLNSDAKAVANETMRRARHNVNLLIEHLKEINFQFAYPNYIFSPPSSEEIALLDEFEREIGRVPLSLRAWMEIVGKVNLIGSFPRLSYYAPNSGLANLQMKTSEGILDLNKLVQEQLPTDGLPSELTGILSNMQNVIQELMSQDLFGGKNLKSDEASKEISEEDQIVSDPLVVEIIELSVDDYEDWQDSGNGPFFVEIAPDILHKANISGGDGYAVYLPNQVADAPLLNTEWGDLSFVEYLRLSFEWAGFPGLKDDDGRDETLIARLKEGFLPL